MSHVSLKNLTVRQQQAYVMRFRYGWKLRQIALELGIEPASAGRLVRCAQIRAGLGRDRVSVMRKKPRRVRLLSRSDWEGSV